MSKPLTKEDLPDCKLCKIMADVIPIQCPETFHSSDKWIQLDDSNMYRIIEPDGGYYECYLSKSKYELKNMN